MVRLGKFRSPATANQAGEAGGQEPGAGAAEERAAARSAPAVRGGQRDHVAGSGSVGCGRRRALVAGPRWRCWWSRPRRPAGGRLPGVLAGADVVVVVVRPALPMVAPPGKAAMAPGTPLSRSAQEATGPPATGAVSTFAPSRPTSVSPTTVAAEADQPTQRPVPRSRGRTAGRGCRPTATAERRRCPDPERRSVLPVRTGDAGFAHADGTVERSTTTAVDGGGVPVPDQ